MNEPFIKYAIDPETQNIVDITAGLIQQKPYICIKCTGELNAVQGTVRIPFFRHAKNDVKAQQCELYYSGNWQDFNREMQISEIEKAEKRKEIRLIIKQRSFGPAIDLFGALPTLSEVPSIKALAVIAFEQNARIRTLGFKRSPPASAFRISQNPEVLFDLDPNSNRFELEITGVDIPEIDGLWKTSPLKEGDIFVGDNRRAERIEKERTVAEGDFVWIVHARVAIVHERIKRLGNWYLEIIPVALQTKSKLASFRNIKIDDNPFFVDVILPANASASPSEAIEGKPNANVIIAVHPPLHLDPEIDVVPIPINNNEPEHLSRGQGKTRWLSTKMPSERGIRFSIYWANRHRIVSLLPNSNQNQQYFQNILGFKIINSDDQRFLPLWEKEILINRRREATKLIDFGIELQIPNGLQFGLIGQFPPGARMQTFTTDGFTKERLDKELRFWIASGLESLKFDFGSLGAPTIAFKEKHRFVLTDEEIKQRISKLPKLPKKVRWPLVRDLLGVPSGTKHQNVEMTLKHIRKLIKEAKEDRDRHS